MIKSGMDTQTSRPILSEERLAQLEAPEEMICIIGGAEDDALYTLTFHAAFAVKIFGIIRREGPAMQGFERMQQSLSDSVEQVRTALVALPDCNTLLRRVEDRSAEAQSLLMRLIRDLARYKNWMLGSSDTAAPRRT